VLVVDDEPANRRLVRRTLHRDYEVVEAASGEEGLAALDADVHVILCDQRMPGMTGLELLKRARTLQPDASRVLITAYPDLDVLADAINEGGIRRYIAKPYELEELKLVVRQEVEHVRLRRRNDALETFVSSASHDLRQPLRTAAAFAALLAEEHGDALSEDGREALQFVVGGIGRVRTLVESMLDYLRAESAPVQLAPVDLEAVLAAVQLDLMAALEEADGEVAWRELPTVWGDEARLRQVLLNLVDNALKYRRPGRAQVRVTARRDGELWEIGVHDNGLGIAPEVADRIFEPFRRLHTASEVPGAGLGLALCRRHVERLGGTIRAESQPGRGTTVFFTVRA